MISTVPDDIPVPPSAKLLGWRLLDARPKDGWLRIGFDGKQAFCNPAGFIQGGILSAMLDDSMGPAVFVMSEGRLYTSTVNLNVSFLAPARPGPLVVEARVAQLGKSVAFMHAKLMDEAGTALALGSASARLIDAAKIFANPRACVARSVA